jgi:hypothetical protein
MLVLRCVFVMVFVRVCGLFGSQKLFKYLWYMVR